MPQAEPGGLRQIDDHLILTARAVHGETTGAHEGLSVLHGAGETGARPVFPHLAGERIKGFVLLLPFEPYAV